MFPKFVPYIYILVHSLYLYPICVPFSDTLECVSKNPLLQQWDQLLLIN